MKTFVGIVVFLMLAEIIHCQVSYRPADVKIFNNVMDEANKRHLSDSAFSQIEMAVGKLLIGTVYVGGVLDKPEQETLVVNFSELDCVTFLESVITFSICIKTKKNTFDDYCNKLTYIRYRNGTINGYASRLHYFYDWINNNEKKGILHNISKEIGGKLYVRQINCMSTHPSLYPLLKDEASLQVIKNTEQELTSMDKYYLPKDEIVENESKIMDGDMIALATTLEGMEVAHVGLAIHQNNRLYFMHASSVNKKVEISSVPLAEMIKNKSIYSGIIVSRLK